MQYVYVVAVGSRGAQKGDFYGKPTAFEDQAAAEVVVFQCREALGGHFVQVEAAGAETDDPEDHIVERWDSDKFTVWLERLVFEAAQ